MVVIPCLSSKHQIKSSIHGVKDVFMKRRRKLKQMDFVQNVIHISADFAAIHTGSPRLLNIIQVLQGVKMPKSQADKSVRYPECNNHRGCFCDYYCIDHDEFRCSKCVRESHSIAIQIPY